MNILIHSWLNPVCRDYRYRGLSLFPLLGGDLHQWLVGKRRGKGCVPQMSSGCFQSVWVCVSTFNRGKAPPWNWPAPLTPLLGDLISSLLCEAVERTNYLHKLTLDEAEVKGPHKTPLPLLWRGAYRHHPWAHRSSFLLGLIWQDQTYSVEFPACPCILQTRHSSGCCN
jgi:hypothetical protein